MMIEKIYESISGEIHLWEIHLDCKEDVLERRTLLLSEVEKVRMANFKFLIDRQRFVCFHGAMREILAKYAKIPPGQLIFHTEEFGKPFFEQFENLQFNLTHSHDKAILAISNASVGVDIEYIRPIDDILEFSSRFFTEQEKDDVSGRSGDDQLKRFYQIWTGKEALIKATGKGLSYDLSSFSIQSSCPPFIVFHNRNQKNGPNESWNLHFIDNWNEYTGACVYAGITKAIRFYEWESAFS